MARVVGVGPQNYEGDIMKKQMKMKKLTLSKETLHALELRAVAAGVSSIDVPCGTGDCNESAPPHYCPREPNR
jgi:hypothetical protein